VLVVADCKSRVEPGLQDTGKIVSQRRHCHGRSSLGFAVGRSRTFYQQEATKTDWSRDELTRAAVSIRQRRLHKNG
jgi:hypothetical protein